MAGRDERGCFIPGRVPEGAKPFKPGVSGNPGGKSKEQKAIEAEASRLGAIASLRLIQAIADYIDEADNLEDHRARIKEHMTSDTLKLIKDVQDRAHGTPKQSVDMSNSDGSLTEMSAEQLLAKRKELEKRLGIASDGVAGKE